VVFEALMAAGAVKRYGRSGPKRRPGRVVGDKAYSSGKIRQHLRRYGMRMTIPRKQNEHRTGPFARVIYCQRERVERLINRLKQNRRLPHLMRSVASCHATCVIAAALLWS
jgi:transposase